MDPTLVVLTVKPSYERDQMLANGKTARKKRSTEPEKHTVSINLRTVKDTGVIYFAGSSDDYILIQVSHRSKWHLRFEVFKSVIVFGTKMTDNYYYCSSKDLT